MYLPFTSSQREAMNSPSVDVKNDGGSGGLGACGGVDSDRMAALLMAESLGGLHE
jgi:hypothetical protein